MLKTRCIVFQVDLAGGNRSLLDDLVESPTHGPRPVGAAAAAAAGSDNVTSGPPRHGSEFLFLVAVFGVDVLIIFNRQYLLAGVVVMFRVLRLVLEILDNLLTPQARTMSISSVTDSPKRHIQKLAGKFVTS